MLYYIQISHWQGSSTVKARSSSRMYKSLVTTIACAVLATASVIAPKAADDTSPSCYVGNQTILYPAAHTNITQEYYNGDLAGERPPFPFRYCSGQYFKTRTRNIQVILGSQASTDPIEYATVLAEANATTAIDGGYILNITVPGGYPGPHPPPPHAWLIVLETYYSYYVPLQTATSRIPIKF